MLTEVLQRYIQLLGKTCVSHASLANRTEIVPRDVASALDQLGTSLEEVRNWIQLEGQEERELAKATGNKGKARALRELLDVGRATTGTGSSVGEHARILRYQEISDERRRELLSEAEQQEQEDALFSPMEQDSDEASYELESAVKLGIPFIPDHLPPLPTSITQAHLIGHATHASRPEHHHHSQSERGAVVHEDQGVRSAQQQQREEEAAEREHETERVRKVITNVWKEVVPFEESQLRQLYTSTEVDLPQIDSTCANAGGNATAGASSLYAFAADFLALQAERSSSARASILMTPEGPTHSATLLKRRRMAASIADPSHYAPLDSLLASVAVRPAGGAVPFVPSPSMLITLPSSGSAPDFTPTNPHGRGICLNPPSGAAQPTLGYRWPAQVQSAVRSVAQLDIQRRVSRIEDPAPLYDSQHVERVFRGIPASRHLLSVAHSALAPSINALAIQQKRKLGVESSDADLELPTKGTLVYTWDWTTRDPFDTALPGKRVRVEDQVPNHSDTRQDPRMQNEDQPQPTTPLPAPAINGHAQEQQPPTTEAIQL